MRSCQVQRARSDATGHTALRPCLQPRSSSRCTTARQNHRTACTSRSETEQAMESESRAEARRKRRQANTLTEATVMVDPADTVMTTDETRVQTTTPQPESAERRKARDLLNRKSDVIIQLATAGTQINDAIRQYRHEIDDLLLEVLEKRIEAASGVEAEKTASQGLFLLWRRLRAERQRMEATPAARLLDDALQAMDPASGLSLQDRQQDTTVLLRRAFSAPGSRPINIFGVAAALAEGQEVAPEDIVNEFVPREAFIAESTELLEGAMQEQKILERSWRAGEGKDNPEAVANLVKERRFAIVQIQEIIALAKTLRL